MKVATARISWERRDRLVAVLEVHDHAPLSDLHDCVPRHSVLEHNKSGIHIPMKRCAESELSSTSTRRMMFGWTSCFMIATSRWIPSRGSAAGADDVSAPSIKNGMKRRRESNHPPPLAQTA